MSKAIYFTLTVSLVVYFFLSTTAYSDVKPIQLSLWENVQLYDSSTSIQGIRLSVYGVNQEVCGIDCGLILNVKGDMKGRQAGIVNLVGGDVTGSQRGFVNLLEGDFFGWQTGGVNINKGQTVGLQAGLFNSTNDLRGLQFGFVNFTETLYGIQIGIVNINNSGTPFKFLPIVNFSF